MEERHGDHSEVGKGHSFPSVLSGLLIHLVTTLRGDQVGVCGWEMTPEEHPKPQLQKKKSSSPKEEGSLPVHSEMGATVGKKGAEWGAHKGIGVFKFFFFLHFLLLKTFPKKCVFPLCLGDM